MRNMDSSEHSTDFTLRHRKCDEKGIASQNVHKSSENVNGSGKRTKGMETLEHTWNNLVAKETPQTGNTVSHFEIVGNETAKRQEFQKSLEDGSPHTQLCSQNNFSEMDNESLMLHVFSEVLKTKIVGSKLIQYTHNHTVYNYTHLIHVL